MFRLVLLFAVLILRAHAASDCGLVTGDVVYDLSPLSNSTVDYSYTSGGVQFTMNVCQSLAGNYPSCSNLSSAVGIFEVNFGQMICKVVGELPGNFSLLDPSNASGGVKVEYTSYEPCESQPSTGYSLTIEFPCDPNATSSGLVNAYGDPNNACHFYFIFSSPYNCPQQTNVPFGPCFNATQDALLQAGAGPVQLVAQTVSIPFATLWPFFTQSELWPFWLQPIQQSPGPLNQCSFLNTTFTNDPGCFPSQYIFPHQIVQVGSTSNGEYAALSWQYQLIDSVEILLAFGRRTFEFQNNGSNSTIVSSWEKAVGPLVDSCFASWLNSLQEAVSEGVAGFQCLERVFQATGELDPTTVMQKCVSQA